MLSNIAIVASLLTAASAHQNFHQFWVNDVSPGYQVSIRMPPSNSPVTDVTSDDITCNVNGNTVPSGVNTTAANEGDTIKVQWDSSSHPGPITHFLYGPVDDASLATGVGSWIKIDEFDSENGTWANEIMVAQDMTYSFKLPTGLQSGEYLLRSEMLALHGAQTVGGAQFYIGCAQLKITGTGSAGSCSPEIQLPGAYSATDDNIYIPNVYNGFDISNYTAPGGPVAACGGTGSGSVATSAAVAVSTATVVPVEAPTATPASSSSAVPIASSIEPVTIPTSLSASTQIEATSTAAGLPTSVAQVQPTPVVSSNGTISSTKKSACKPKTTTQATLPTSIPFSNSTISTSTRKSACKAKTSSGLPIITSASGLNNNVIVPTPTTLATAVRTTSASAGPTAAATVRDDTATEAPSGTSLDTLLKWLASFYNGHKGTEYDSSTTV